MSQMHYLPLAPGFFAILVGFFFIVLMLRIHGGYSYGANRRMDFGRVAPLSELNK
jgi:hypothetical protein